jgi:hypothetical protein
VFYLLNEEGEPFPVPFEELGRLLQAGSLFADMRKRRVAETQRDGVSVSTVFLMLGYRMDEGLPALWETMIFGGEHDGYQERSRTLEESVLSHRQAVRAAFPVDPPETVWGVLPTLRLDGTVGPSHVKEVLGLSVWERLMKEVYLV